MSLPSSNTTTPIHPPSQDISNSSFNPTTKSKTVSASGGQRKSCQSSSRKEGTRSGPEDLTDVDDKHHQTKRSKRYSLPPSSSKTSGSSYRSSQPRSKESLSKFPLDFSLHAQVRATKQAQSKYKSSRRSTGSTSRTSIGHDHSDKSVPSKIETPMPSAFEKAGGIDPSSLFVPTERKTASTVSSESTSTLTQNSYETQMDEAKVESPDSHPSPLGYSALPLNEGVPMIDQPNTRSPKSNEISSGKEVIYPVTPSPHSMSPPYSYGSSGIPDTASTRSTVPSPTGPWPNVRSDDYKTFGIPSYDASRAQMIQTRSGGPAFHPSDLQRMRYEDPAWYARPPQENNTGVGGQGQAHHDYMALFEQGPKRFASEQLDSSQTTPATWWRQPQTHQEHFQRQRPSSAGVPPESGETGLKESRPPPRNNSRPAPAPPAPDPPDLSGITLEGYELLATRLADTTLGVRPIYRKFEKLNHRILLWLQDEICGYEDQLRVLDEWIAQTERTHNEGKSKPASRRAEQYSNSELYYQRKFVLGEIFVKMELYYRVLGSYREVSKDVHLPKQGEVTAYREWMTANRPVDEYEAAFLKHDQDLIVLPRRNFETSSVRVAAGGVTFLLLLPIIAFALIPSLVGRVFMVAVIAIAQWMMVSTMEIRRILTVREWIVCTGIYVMVMAMIAAVPR